MLETTYHIRKTSLIIYIHTQGVAQKFGVFTKYTYFTTSKETMKTRSYSNKLLLMVNFPEILVTPRIYIYIHLHVCVCVCVHVKCKFTFMFVLEKEKKTTFHVFSKRVSIVNIL
jgi:hypothetical protein